MRHVCVFLFCFVSSFAFSQDYRVDLFGGYSYLNVDTNNLTSRQNLNGWEASVSGNFNKWIAAEADVNGFYKTYNILGIDVAVRDYSYLAGPRINFKPLFIHALVGGDHLSAGALGISGSQDGLAGAFGGGVQWKFSRQFSFRVSADYAFSRHNILGGSSVTQNNVRASVGIVYSFGHVGEPAPQRQPGTRPIARGAGMQIASLGLFVVPTANNTGAQVTEVAPNSVAELSGLHPDDIINSVNGVQIQTPMDLANALSGTAPGTKIRLGYMIRGEWQTEKILILAATMK